MEHEFDDIFGEYEEELEEEKRKKDKGKDRGIQEENEEKGQVLGEGFTDLDELSKMMGVKPKSAAIISGIDKISLCSMCALREITADCFDGKQGSFAVIDAHKRDPEKDAQDLTETFKGLEVILILNRDQNLSARVYKEGKQKEKIIPPIALFGFPDLRSYLIGIDDLEKLKEGKASINSASISKEEALTLLKQIFRP